MRKIHVYQGLGLTLMLLMYRVIHLKEACNNSRWDEAFWTKQLRHVPWRVCNRIYEALWSPFSASRMNVFLNVSANILASIACSFEHTPKEEVWRCQVWQPRWPKSFLKWPCCWKKDSISHNSSAAIDYTFVKVCNVFMFVLARVITKYLDLF